MKHVIITYDLVKPDFAGKITGALGALIAAHGHRVGLIVLRHAKQRNDGEYYYIGKYVFPKDIENYYTWNGQVTGSYIGYFERFVGKQIGNVSDEYIFTNDHDVRDKSFVDVLKKHTSFTFTDDIDIAFVLVDYPMLDFSVAQREMLQAVRCFRKNFKTAYVHLSHWSIDNTTVDKTWTTRYAHEILEDDDVHPNLYIYNNNRSFDSCDTSWTSIPKFWTHCNRSDWDYVLEFSEKKIDGLLLGAMDELYEVPDLKKWEDLDKVKLDYGGRFLPKVTIAALQGWGWDCFTSIREALHHAALKCEVAYDEKITFIDHPAYQVSIENGCIIIPDRFIDHPKPALECIQFCRDNRIPLLLTGNGVGLLIMDLLVNVLKEPFDAVYKKIKHDSDHPNVYYVYGSNDILAGNKWGLTSEVFDSYNNVYGYLTKIKEQSLYKCTAFLKDHSKVPVVIENDEDRDSFHPFLVGCEFYPECNSSYFEPHPIFVEFIRAAYKRHVETPKSAPHSVFIEREYFSKKD